MEWIGVDLVGCLVNALSFQKAARKTDRPRTEETDVTELTDEDLREQLVKHGVETGPIVGEFRGESSLSLLVFSMPTNLILNFH